MQPLRFTMAIILTLAAFAAGCGGSGDGGGGTTGPAPAVLTTVEVTPGTATLFTVSPVNTVVLTVLAKDQYGAQITNASTSFSSQNGSVATVANDGTVSAAGAGVAQVTASVTAGGVTKSGATTVTVQVAAAAATVTAPGFSFSPGFVDISLGGSVTWTIEAIRHNVTFGSTAAPPSIDDLVNASASRTFPAKGIFDYFCSLHSGMTGTVRVH